MCINRKGSISAFPRFTLRESLPVIGGGACAVTGRDTKKELNIVPSNLEVDRMTSVDVLQ